MNILIHEFPTSPPGGFNIPLITQIIKIIPDLILDHLDEVTR